MGVVLQPGAGQQFTEAPLSDYDLQKLVDITAWAPSPFNTQPWEFIVLQEPQHISDLINTAGHQIAAPPNLLVVLNDISRRDPGPNAYRLGLIAVGAAMANLMAAAAYSNIGLYSISIDNEDIRSRLTRYLNIPDHIELCCLLAAGYLNPSSGSNTPKKPLSYYKDDITLPVELAPPDNPPQVINPFITICQRKSYRKKFMNRAISEEHLYRLLESALESFLFESPDKVTLVLTSDKLKLKKLSRVAATAAYLSYMDKGYARRMSNWMHYNSEEKMQSADGIYIVLLHQMLSGLLKIGAWLMEEVKLFYPLRVLCMKLVSRFFFGKLVADSPAVCTFMLEYAGQRDEINPCNYINAGISIQSLLICATAYGMGAQFLSNLVDIKSTTAALEELLLIPPQSNKELVILLRLGYIDPRIRAKILSVSSNVRRPNEKILHRERY